MTVDVKAGETGDDEEEKQGFEEEGVSLPPWVRWPEEGHERWQQCGAAGARRIKAGDPCASGPEESSKRLRV